MHVDVGIHCLERRGRSVVDRPVILHTQEGASPRAAPRCLELRSERSSRRGAGIISLCARTSCSQSTTRRYCPASHLSYSCPSPSMSNYLYLDTHSPRRQQQYYLQSHPSCSCVYHHPQYSIHRNGNGNGRMVSSMPGQILPPPRFIGALHQVTPHPPSGGGRSLDPRAQSFFVSIIISIRKKPGPG